MKNETSAKLEPVRVSLDYGVVREKTGSGVMVEARGATFTAVRAAGCLIEPEPGDLVLLSEDTFGRAYVLSVLERHDGPEVCLAFEGDVSLKVNHGRLQATAGEGLDLACGGEMNVLAPALNLTAAAADLSVGRMNFVGGLLESSVEKIKLAAHTCDSVFDRVSQKAHNSYRWITGLENVKAGSLSYAAQKLLSLRAKYSAMTAEKDVRIDGDKILMG